jgi:hypothetical protein
VSGLGSSGGAALGEGADRSVSGTPVDVFTADGVSGEVGVVAGDGGSDTSMSPETATAPHPTDLPEGR